MPESAEETSPSPPGVHFVYESGLTKIAQQEKLIDSLGVKMGVLIALLGAFIVGLLAVALTSLGGKLTYSLWMPTKGILLLGMGLIVVCLCCAFFCVLDVTALP
ncbi:MAG: hypothetical protein ACRD3T_16370, partial [Terriglobia bacterium]